MNIDQTRSRPGLFPAPVRAARVVYVSAAWLFIAGILLQVFVAGLALLVDGDRLDLHRALGYLVFCLPPAMLVAGLAGRLPRWTLALTALLILRLILKDTFIYLPADGDLAVLRALHPVNALVIFLVALPSTRIGRCHPPRLGLTPLHV